MELIRVIFRMLLEGGWIKYRAVFLVLGVASCVIVGWFDYITTEEVNLSFVYLLPVFFTTVAMGRTGGLSMALACAVVKIITDVYSGQPYSRSVYYAFNGLGLFAAFAAFSLLLDGLRTAYKRECDVYRKDELTGLPNRRDFFAVAGEEWTRCRRAGTPFAMLVVDFDNFKKFNATRGHHVGDLVLQAVARSARKALNEADILYRLGGDDFAVVLAEADPQKARQAAERLQQKLASTMSDKGWCLATSICVVSCVDFATSLDDILNQVNTTLYTSKHDNNESGVIVELSF